MGRDVRGRGTHETCCVFVCVVQWHPDKFSTEEEKKVAEKKFMDIAAAKEALSDDGALRVGRARVCVCVCECERG